MKKIIITTLSFLSIGVSAQKTDKTNIDYEVEMLPIELISKEKKFKVTVDYEYRSKSEAATADINARKDQAAEDKAEYDKKNFGEKLLQTKVMGEAKPTGYYYSNSFIPTLFPEEPIKALINIPAYTKSTDAKGIVNVIFSELTYTLDPTKTKLNYNPLRVTLNITNDKGVSVYQGHVPYNYSALTISATTAAEMEKNMLANLKGAETNAKNKAIENINAFLKLNYGFNLVKNDRPFFDIKDKKQSYPEYHEAIEKVKNAFIYCNNPSKQDVMITKLKEAIAIWENSLKELDKGNKEARINNDVAAATYLNLAEASIWVKDFDKAFEYLVSHKALDQDYSRTYKDVSEFLKDYSSRYNKYTTY